MVQRINLSALRECVLDDRRARKSQQHAAFPRDAVPFHKLLDVFTWTLMWRGCLT
jgi:hypothetical protein